MQNNSKKFFWAFLFKTFVNFVKLLNINLDDIVFFSAMENKFCY